MTSRPDSFRFGTDGIRGVANADLTPELTLALGRAAARVLGGASRHGTTMLIGRDTRCSGDLLLAALTAGFCAEGMNVVDLGVLPTPAVAHASSSANAPAAMISASHNAFQDNGIKFFLAGGRKLPDDVEARIEAELDSLLVAQTCKPLTGGDLGNFKRSDAEHSAYEESLVGALEGRRLDGLRVVLDCANGATSRSAPEVFRRLGAIVTALHDTPDGVNINESCGSTHPQSLQAAVLQHGADVGFAFDGDADRMLAVDNSGALVDGDQLMAMTALDMRDRGLLAHNVVVVTVMTNLGFKIAMKAAGIDVVETKVGDRYVLEALEEGGYSLGGEQSGHIILRDRASTGDGTLSALVIADLLVRRSTTLAEQGAVMHRLPQVLRNVKGVDRSRLDSAAGLWADVREAEAELGETGRVLLRPSGTESLVRVMVEASTPELAESVCARLCESVVRELG
jgi:phosphoglucosamine mutase